MYVFMYTYMFVFNFKDRNKAVNADTYKDLSDDPTLKAWKSQEYDMPLGSWRQSGSPMQVMGMYLFKSSPAASQGLP